MEEYHCTPALGGLSPVGEIGWTTERVYKCQERGVGEIQRVEELK